MVRRLAHVVGLRFGGQSNPGFAFRVSATNSVQRKHASAERDYTRGALLTTKDISTVAYDTLANGKQMYQQDTVAQASFFPQGPTILCFVAHCR